MPAPRLRPLLSATVGAALCATGCFNNDQQIVPPAREFNYPTTLTVSPGGTVLYVANSDFDLQFSGGTMQVLDLGTCGPGTRGCMRTDALALRDALEGATQGEASVCGDFGLGTNDNPVLLPGPCRSFPASPYIKQFATIGAFASSATLAIEPDADGALTGRARLLLTVRGDPSVTFFDVVNDGSAESLSQPVGSGACTGPFCLECQAQGDTRRCGPQHRVGENASLTTRGIVLPVEPVGIAASDDARVVVVAHQTSSQASLLVNAWSGAPELEFPLAGLPPGPTEVARLPTPGIARALAGSFDYGASFLITFREAPEVDLVRFNSDSGSSPSRPFLTQASRASISVNSDGGDSRGAAVDGSARAACEATCSAGQSSCLVACAEDFPLRAFIANRAPPSLLIGEIRTQVVLDGDTPVGAVDSVRVFQNIPLSFGASRVHIGHVLDEQGQKQLRVFVVSFDAREIVSYDPEARRVESLIHTGRGPHALATDTREGDEGYSLLYVGHFSDSFLGVVDLDMRHPKTFGQMFAAVGVPNPPPEMN
ncbi:MAG: hypothetical protein WKG00_24055 [Polyangiaceae bacterium]